MGGRKMISRELFDRAVELLHDRLSVSQTAKRLDLGECVVRRIAHGKHALQQPPTEPKPRNWRNQYNKIPEPTPEEIEAACRKFQQGWSDTAEWGHRVTKCELVELPVVPEAWLEIRSARDQNI